MDNINRKLSELKAGQKAIIRNFTNNDLYLKLMEMGCLPGEEISLEQIAPLGDPISISVSGYSLSLRLNEAEHIEVELTSELGSKKLGEWAASDLGPGGGNILFAVTNVEDALQTILQFLKRNNLDKNVLIGRRILISSDDWFYEVIYPTKYSGDFNTM